MRSIYISLIILLSSCNLSKNEIKIFWPNGNIKSLEYFDKNQQNYIVERFDSLGRLLNKAIYTDNQKTGEVIFYHPSGRIKEKANLSNNKLDGKYITYFESGVIKSIGYYKENKPIGNTENYNEKGNLIKVSQTYLTDTAFLVGEFDSLGNAISEHPFIRVKMKNDTILNGNEALITFKIFKRQMLDSISVKLYSATGVSYITIPDNQDSVTITLPKYIVGHNLITGEFKSRIKDRFYDTSIVYINLKVYQPFFVK